MRFFKLSLKTYACFLLLAVSFNGYAQTSPIKQTSSGDNHQVASVALLNFNVKSDEPNKIVLQWSTGMERNNDRFEINLSTDSLNFVQYAVVKGKGTPTSTASYEITIDVKTKVVTTAFFLSFLLVSSVRNRKLQIAIIGLFALTVLSCSKKDDGPKKYYVHFIQIDTDGKAMILGSKSVKVEVPK